MMTFRYRLQTYPLAQPRKALIWTNVLGASLNFLQRTSPISQEDFLFIPQSELIQSSSSSLVACYWPSPTEEVGAAAGSLSAPVLELSRGAGPLIAKNFCGSILADCFVLTPHNNQLRHCQRNTHRSRFQSSVAAPRAAAASQLLVARGEFRPGGRRRSSRLALRRRCQQSLVLEASSPVDGCSANTGNRKQYER